MASLDTTAAYTQAEHEKIIRQVGAKYRSLSAEDVEDAVQNAAVASLDMARRGKGAFVREGSNPLGGIVRLAYMRASTIARQHRTQLGSAKSLDQLQEDHGDAFLPASDDPLDQVEARMALEGVVADALRSELVAAARYGDGRIRPRGAGAANSVISSEQADEIRRLRCGGASYREIAAQVGVSHHHCKNVAKRRCHAATTVGWTAELVEAAIRDFYEKHGRTPTQEDSRNNPLLPATGTTYRTHGGWGKALIAAGYEPRSSSRGIKLWPRRRQIAALRRFYRFNGRRPTSTDLRKRTPGLPALQTIMREFGGLPAACEASGLPAERDHKPPPNKRSAAELIGVCRAFVRREGRLPCTSDLGGGRGLPAIQTLKARFGSFRGWVVASGFHPVSSGPHARPLPDKEVASIRRDLVDIGALNPESDEPADVAPIYPNGWRNKLEQAAIDGRLSCLCWDHVQEAGITPPPEFAQRFPDCLGRRHGTLETAHNCGDLKTTHPIVEAFLVKLGLSDDPGGTEGR